MLRPNEEKFELSSLRSFRNDPEIKRFGKHVDILANEYYEIEGVGESSVHVIARYSMTGYDVDPDQKEAFEKAVEAYGKDNFTATIEEGMYHEYTLMSHSEYSAVDAATELLLIDSDEVFDLLVQNEELEEAVAELVEGLEYDRDLLCLLVEIERPELDMMLANSEDFQNVVLGLINDGELPPRAIPHLQRIARLTENQGLLDSLEQEVHEGEQA